MATPAWLTENQKQEMKDILAQGSRDIHVDHIVPIQSKFVCGLNVPWNLELVSSRENQDKKNYYWPDMWEHYDPRITGKYPQHMSRSELRQAMTDMTE